MRPQQPLVFKPLLQTRVWGGNVLRERRAVRGAIVPGNEPVGESWELVDRPEAQSIVAEGEFKGQSLHELFSAHRDDLCGKGVDPANPDVFPLILKLLDAREDLSVQVHPDDGYAAARRPGELGKTEAWYVLEADPGAALYRGLVPGTDRETFESALRNPEDGAGGGVASLLRRLPARPGDAFHLPAGMIHALGAGVRIAEIQQNSDTTYRVFDWNRVGLDGRPRELHIDDALAVADFAEIAAGADRAVPAPLSGLDHHREILVRDDKFTMEYFRDFAPNAAHCLPTADGFRIILCLRGNVTVGAGGRSVSLNAWDSALIPAAAEWYSLTTIPEAEILLFYR